MKGEKRKAWALFLVLIMVLGGISIIWLKVYADNSNDLLWTDERGSTHSLTYGHEDGKKTAVIDSKTIVFSKWEKEDSLPENGDYYLTEDIILAQKQSFGNLNLDLNGHRILLDESIDGWCIIDEFSSISIFDSAGTGVIDGNHLNKTFIYNTDNFLALYGGTLRNFNRAVCLNGSDTNESVFIMCGGSITGNENTGKEGSGVSLGNGNTFYMYGGTITGNATNGNGGGVSVGADRNGGDAVFIMTGGSVTGNHADGNGDDVWMDSHENCFLIQGTSDIGYVYLTEGRKICVARELDESVEISVGMEETGVFTTGLAGREVSNFKSAMDGCRIVSTDDGEAKLARVYRVMYNDCESDSGSLPEEDESGYIEGSTVTVPGNLGNLKKEGYNFDGWNTKADGSGTAYAKGDTFVISKDITLYAVWKEDDTVSFTPLSIKQGQYIRMGSYKGVDVDWFCAVINGKGTLMLSKYVLATSAFGTNGTYKTSYIHKWLDIDSGGTFATDLGLTKRELGLARTVNLSGDFGDGTDKFIIPSLAELKGKPYTKAAFIYAQDTIASIYWLRTKRDDSTARVVRSAYDKVDDRYSGVTYGGRGIRPMFYLDTAAIQKIPYTGSGTADDPYEFESRYDISANIAPDNNVISAKAARDGMEIFIGGLPGRLVKGAKVILEPEADHVWESLTINDTEGTEVGLSDNIFTMPEDDVLISANYGITYKETENGSLKGSSTAVCGETVTFSVTPDAGYAVGTVSVKHAEEKEEGAGGTSGTDGAGGTSGTDGNNVDIEEIEVTDNQDGTYSFTMPADKVTVTATFTEHEHDWSYTADGAAITAKCNSTKGTCLVEKGLKLTICVPEGQIYDGAAKKAVLNTNYNKEAFPADKISEISYIRNDTGVFCVPVEAGTYTAVVTVGDETNHVSASAQFTIEKAPSDIIAEPVAKTGFVYDGKAWQLVDAGEAAGGEIKYALGGEDGKTLIADWSTAVPEAVEAGTYTVFYYLAGDSNHQDIGSEGEPSGSLQVTIERADAEIVSQPAEKKDIIYNGQAQKLMSDGISKDGRWLYCLDQTGEWRYELPSVAEAGSYTVEYYFEGDKNHKDAGSKEEPFGSVSVMIEKAGADEGEIPVAVTGLVSDGENKKLVLEGKSADGIYQYSLGFPGEWSEMVPSVKEAGIYIIYYYLKGDKNHKDIGSEKAPQGNVGVIITSKGTWALTGRVFLSDGRTGLEGAKVRLMQGNKEVAKTTTLMDGSYHLAAAGGVYNIIICWKDPVRESAAEVIKTVILNLDGNMEQDIIVPSGKADSVLKVGKDIREVVAGGLDEEAETVYLEHAGKEVSVVMSVEKKEEKETNGLKKIKKAASDKKLEFFDISVQKTVDNVTTSMKNTKHVLEVVLPCQNADKKGLTVYRYHDSKVTALKESDTEEDGTFWLDVKNRQVHIYTNKFSTYAVGYTPYFDIGSTLDFGSFTGDVNLVLKKNGDSAVLEDMTVPVGKNTGKVSFKAIPKGNYELTMTWMDGKENTLKVPLEVK